MNPLSGYGAPNVPEQPNNPQVDMTRFIQQFNKFASAFTGDPYQAVQELLQTGKILPSQFYQYKTLAEQIARFFQFFPHQ